MKKNLITAGSLIGAALAVLGGHLVREGIEFGSSANSLWARNQNLVASADRADEISAMEYYAQMADMLENEYVDPVTDQNKLLAGSLRGMLASLRDAHSFFLPTEQWKIFKNARSGKYEGIGADFVLDPTANKHGQGETDWTVLMPRLIIASVVPGGPADKAGMKAGDSIELVDKHWVANGAIVQRFIELEAKVKKGEAKVEELDKVRAEYREKVEKPTTPARAVEKLTSGVSGTVAVSWLRAGKQFDATITRAATTAHALVSSGGVIALNLRPGAAELLKEALSTGEPVVLDLRNNVFGDPKAMQDVLSLLAPSGVYGQLAKDRPVAEDSGVASSTSTDEKPVASILRKRPLEAKGGSALRVSTVIVDASTWDAAQVLALALKEAGAKLDDRGMDGDAFLVQQVEVKDVGGYTVTTERFVGTKEKGR